MSQEFTLKNIEKTRNYFVEEIYQNKLISKKHKKVCTTLKYNFLILASTVTKCISVSVFTSSMPIEITSSPVRTKICAITAGIKKYKSITKKKKKKQYKIVLLVKSKWKSIEVLISKF